MIYFDQDATPSDTARTLWRELGPHLCIAIALMIAVRESESRSFELDLSGLRNRMRPPENANSARPGKGGAAAIEIIKLGQPQLRSNVHRLQVWSDRLERRIEYLAAMADWRDELQSRIRRAELRFEHVGLDADEQDALAAEVAEFNQVCTGLAGEIPTKTERRAA